MPFIAEKHLKRYLKRPDVFINLLAVAIGIVSGLVAICFRIMIETYSSAFNLGNILLFNPLGAGRYYLAAISMIGGLIAGGPIYRYGPETKTSGIPQVMESMILKGGRIRPRVIFLKALVSGVMYRFRRFRREGRSDRTDRVGYRFHHRSVFQDVGRQDQDTGRLW